MDIIHIIKDFLQDLGSNLDALIGQYDNLIIIGDFNAECNESSMENFCETYDLFNLIMEPTCYKDPSSIDVILTNRKSYFQNSCTLDTSLSDFHEMIITVMKMRYKKLEPNIISYGNYKNFDNEILRNRINALVIRIMARLY